MRRQVIKVGSYSFAARRQRTCGHNNNCLGYALRGNLLVSPQKLRVELAQHLQTAAEDDRHIMATSILADDDCERLRRRELIDKAEEELAGDCFIPADVFIHYVQSGHNQHILKTANYVFLSELEQRDIYVPILCHWEDRRRYATHYIGCNSNNTHYSTIHVDDGELLNELLQN
jgi:hypothetical protein